MEKLEKELTLARLRTVADARDKLAGEVCSIYPNGYPENMRALEKAYSELEEAFGSVIKEEAKFLAYSLQ